MKLPLRSGASSNEFPGEVKLVLEELENELLLIEAIEERNRAQIYSFIDEQDQWDAMEENERDLLLRKDIILEQIDKLKSESELN